MARFLGGFAGRSREVSLFAELLIAPRSRTMFLLADFCCFGRFSRRAMTNFLSFLSRREAMQDQRARP
jgi:hypothetical protein